MEIIGKDSAITLERQEYYLKEAVRVICINKSEKGRTRPQVMQHPLLPRISEHVYLGDSMIVNILVVYAHCIFPRGEAAEKTDAGRVAPISVSVWCLSPIACLRFTIQQYSAAYRIGTLPKN